MVKLIRIFGRKAIIKPQLNCHRIGIIEPDHFHRPDYLCPQMAGLSSQLVHTGSPGFAMALYNGQEDLS